MTPGIRTEAVFKLRVLTSTVGTWVLRDEYDDDGQPIGSQQLRPDGTWGEIHTDAEFYAGDPAPTSPVQRLRLSPHTVPPVMTTPPANPYVGPGSGTWITTGPTSGTFSAATTSGTFNAATTATTAIQNANGQSASMVTVNPKMLSVIQTNPN